MNWHLRPIPYPANSAQRRKYIATALRCGWVSNYRAAVARIVAANKRARNTPLKDERCGAHARTTGCPCRAKALANGRCKNHGGLSTGPKTAEGKKKSAANLRRC